MPLLSPVGAEILIAGVTIVWGIVVETWYVSRWTIFFNIVPMIAMLSVFEGDSGTIQFMGIFLLISLLAVGITGRQWLKQLVGAKGYGVFSFCLGLVSAGIIPREQFFGYLLFVGFFVGVIWALVYLAKDRYD